MTYSELREKLYELVAEYFSLLDEKGSIVWGRTKAVKPNNPMIALSLSDITRPYRPTRRYINGVPHDSYPSKTILRVDLFTKGASTSDESSIAAQNENTAVNDLTDFANFINSVHVDHWCGENGISLSTRTVQDLTALVNNTSWSYRALLEIDIGFMQNAAGYSATMFEGGVPLHENGTPMFDSEGYSLDESGIRLTDECEQPLPPLPVGDDDKPLFPQVKTTHSGGRTQELANKSTGYFSEVEINEKKEAPRYA